MNPKQEYLEYFYAAAEVVQKVPTIPTTKGNITLFAQAAAQRVREGEVSALRMLVQIRAWQQMLAELNELIREDVADEYDRTAVKNEAHEMGATITKTGGGWDFFGCDDPQLVEAEAELKALRYNDRTAELEKLIKARKSYLQTIANSGGLALSQDGELSSLPTPKADVIKVTLPK